MKMKCVKFPNKSQLAEYFYL